MKYVTLTKVSDSYQASFVKEELAREGIECMVVNENAANLLSFAGSIGDIPIRVLDIDYARAMEVLNKLRSNTSIVVCPNCNSENVKHGVGTRNAFIRAFLFVSFLFVGTGPARIELTYRCSDCGQEFRKRPI